EYKPLFRLGMPVMATQLGIITVSFADTAMVGAYGVDELAAAAFVNSMFMIPVVMQIGFASGITPLIGALFGRDDHEEAGRTLRAGLQVNAFLSVGLTIFMGILYFFLDCFGQPQELLPLIRGYYLIILASMFPMAIFNCSQQTANAVNDTAMPMWIILSANVLNIFGNYLLIYGKWGCPELGLNGAGLSTLTARWLSTIAILIVFLTTKRYSPYKKEALGASHVGHIRNVVWQTSWPVMIQSGIECGLWSFGAIVTGWFGKIQLAAYQIINTISQLGFMTFMSFGVAVSIRASNATGAGDIQGVRRITVAGLHLNLVLAAIASIVFWFWGDNLTHLFSPDSNVLASAKMLIIPLVLYQFGDATQLTFANGLRGTGNTKPFLWVSIIAYILIGVPAMFWLAKGLDMGNVGVYYSFSFALFAAAILLYIFFKKTIKNLSCPPILTSEG
ncbi:MAG: MATE family efflux transporter, partial [Muribaculaceae bacterium]|nr:MATE family efflux transporter [Muribaculaceae bacterium]